MADWRNPADYRFPKDFPPVRWAWEFLRRNPEYRQDWAKVLERYRDNAGSYGPFEESVAFHDQTDHAWHPDPDHPDFFLPESERETWILSDVFNPATDRPGFLHFDLNFGFLFFKREGATVRPAGERYPWAFFDLHAPLKPQLQAVQRALEEAQKLHGITPLGAGIAVNFQRIPGQGL